MQEFLTNNIVNWNLMSLTGYRTLVILEALIESPKTNDEINEYLFNNQYIKEKFSNDTLRLYINSLREIGCEIIPANKSANKKYELISHPFTFDIAQSQIKALEKLYKNIVCEKVDTQELIGIENFLQKLAALVDNQTTKEHIYSVSILKGINRSILDDLVIHCKNKNQIKFLYNSPKSGEKSIEIIADKIAYKSNKLYLWGTNLTHKEYSYFALDRILEITNIQLHKDEKDYIPLKVVYELYGYNDSYILESDERIIEQTDEKLVIEAVSQNRFSLVQRILHHSFSCKVIAPKEFADEVFAKLKAMEAMYEDL